MGPGSEERVAGWVQWILAGGDGGRERRLEDVCAAHPDCAAAVRDLLERTVAWEEALAAEPPAPGASEAHWPAVGDNVGEFSIVDLIAIGGTSRVYLARQHRLRRNVALKVFAVGRRHARERARFLREVAALASLSAHGLLEIHCSGEDGERGWLWYAMRYVPGPTLERLLQRLAGGRPPDGAMQRDLVRRFHEVASALAVMHRHGRVHRDVKPSNIILEARASCEPWQCPAVLVDFGLVHDGAEGIRSARGTLAYAAPEALRRGHAVGRAADVFSLGLTMYDLLAARAPAPADRPRAAAAPPLLEVAPVDLGLAAIVAKATARSPRQRYPDAGALAAALAAWLGDEPTAAPPLAAPPRRSSRSTVAFALVGLALAAGLSFMAPWRALPSPSSGATSAALTPSPPAWARDALAAMRSGGPGDEPVRRVAGELDRGDVDGALALAAAFLSRDGLAAHPPLLRLLTASLSADGPSLPRHVALLARLACERTDDVLDRAPVAELRTALVALLPRRDATIAAYAMSALSGCGSLDDLPAVFAACEAASAAGRAGGVELIRLGLRCAAEAVRREHARGGDTAADSHATVARALALVAAVRDSHPDAHLPLASALQSLLLRILHAARQRGMAPPALPAELALPELRAAAGDRTLRDDLAADRDPFRGERYPGDMPALACHAAYERLGWLAACFADPALLALAAQHAQAAANAHGRDPGHCLRLFERGAASVRAALAGRRPLPELDPPTWLAARLGPRQAADPPLPVRRDEPAAGEVARWDFCRGACRIAGTAMPPRTRGVTLVADEVEPGETHVRLPPTGDAELCLPFRVQPGAHEGAHLHVLLQKGGREALPYRGRAELTIAGDSEPMRLQVPDTEAKWISVPLASAVSAAAVAATIRLLPESDTTLRIYTAIIRVQ